MVKKIEKPTAKEMAAWRPLALTFPRVTRIFELTGFDPLSPEGHALLRATTGIAARLKIAHALMSPELETRGITRDEYIAAFETLNDITKIYEASMKVIANFFQSHAPAELKPAVAELIAALETGTTGGAGETPTDSQPSPASEISEASRFES